MRPHRRQPTRFPHPWDSPGKNTGVGCHFLLQCMKVKSESEVAQSCPTLSDPIDCSLPGSSVHGIFQTRVLGVGCHCLLQAHSEYTINICCCSWCYWLDNNWMLKFLIWISWVFSLIDFSLKHCKLNIFSWKGVKFLIDVWCLRTYALVIPTSLSCKNSLYPRRWNIFCCLQFYSLSVTVFCILSVSFQSCFTL